MKIRTGVCVLIVTGSAAWAQLSPATIIGNTRNKLQGASKAQEQRSNEALGGVPAKPGANVPAKNVPVTQAANVPSKNVPVKHVGAPGPSIPPVAHTATRKTVKPKKAQAVVPAKEAKAEKADPSIQTIMTTVRTVHGKRDPFVSVIRNETGEVGCATGKKCLVVDQVTLKGVVRSENGVIAVVQNREGKTYFLHEKDPVFNGQVIKIQPDSIVFRETVIDRVGKQSAREVVKRIETTPTAG